MTKEQFLTVVIRLRVTQLYYHYCHNLTHGPMFFSYHELFGEFYPEVEVDYDKIIEYAVAVLGIESIDTETINTLVAEELNEYKIEQMSPEEMIENSLKVEQDLYSDLNSLFQGSIIGLQNSLGGIAERSDVRQYKLKQLMR